MTKKITADYQIRHFLLQNTNNRNIFVYAESEYDAMFVRMKILP